MEVLTDGNFGVPPSRVPTSRGRGGLGCGKLATLLKDMQARPAPDSQWLFPSPQRGGKDLPAKSFVESMRLAKQEAGVSRFGFHDCRHFFISFCVMSGIDYLTIARWVGHKDGGILIGKVYGHLSNEHAKRQAKRLSFGGCGVG